MTMAVDDAERFRKVTSEDIQLPTIGYKDGVYNRIPLDENIKFIIRDMYFIIKRQIQSKKFINEF